jgi:hypothetical protein
MDHLQKMRMSAVLCSTLISVEKYDMHGGELKKYHSQGNADDHLTANVSPQLCIYPDIKGNA